MASLISRNFYVSIDIFIFRYLKELFVLFVIYNSDVNDSIGKKCNTKYFCFIYLCLWFEFDFKHQI
jgi:hypothetical protein